MGVDFYPVCDPDEDSDRIVEVISSVSRIASDTVKIVGSVPCIPLEDSVSWVPVSNFRASVDDSFGDTHDLRSRWFASEAEAREHVRWTMARWNNPQPWEVFVTI